MGRKRSITAASTCIILVVSYLLTSSPLTTHGFSPQKHVSTRWPASTIGVLATTSPFHASIIDPHAPHMPRGVVRPRPSSSSIRSKPRKADIDLTDDEGGISPAVHAAEEKAEYRSAPPVRSIALLVTAQALLLPISALLGGVMKIPNRGLGAGFSLTTTAAVLGMQWTAPLFVVAGLMHLLEPYSPALRGVTRATQRSVLAVMGKGRRPVFAFVVSILLGGVAGWGEEWLFRGVLQTMVSERYSSRIGLAVSGVVFGLLHAVTPVYALLAGLASVFFGYLYNISGNLAVPMICHAVYDVGALMWAHWSATALSSKEQDEILESGPLAPIMDAGQLNSFE
ncbi:hypothetical protein ACHAXA_001683 [Cyclostephanos tholiformis]|uniref:CAAX prenyl protease 2/Lysostaphin resistance protein A-like domain-containing protein n=1 Tax=Cyclostephanos tholiformis TaxID=382380 RepID=A0ABD3RSY3_9STRA